MIPKKDHTPFTRTAALSLLLGAATFSQAATPQTGKPAETVITPEVQALLDKTLKNLRFVEGGSFQMGDFGRIYPPEYLPLSYGTDDKVLHKVTLDSFSMSAYKASFADMDVYSAATGKPKVGMDKITLKINHRSPQAGAGVNWYHARSYCQWLGKLLKLPMDLPTEAQWEYAARNRGELRPFATDTGLVDPGRNVWSYDQREAYIRDNELRGGPSLVLGYFPPNPLGLYDMMTEGQEWVLDWYDPDYYAKSPELNPQGPAKGKEKVLRGTRSSSGEHLSNGDGRVMVRDFLHPNPPGYNMFTKKPDPTVNMTTDTMARCVVNLAHPLTAPNVQAQ